MPVTRAVVASALEEDEWRQVGAVPDGAPLGAIVYGEPGGPRRALIYGWLDDHPGVWRTPAGADVAATGHIGADVAATGHIGADVAATQHVGADAAATQHIGADAAATQHAASAAGLEKVADLSDGHAESLVVRRDGDKLTLRFVVE